MPWSARRARQSRICSRSPGGHRLHVPGRLLVLSLPGPWFFPGFPGVRVQDLAGWTVLQRRFLDTRWDRETVLEAVGILDELTNGNTEDELVRRLGDPIPP